MNAQIPLRNALRSRLESLRLRHPRYSLRAFAKKAGVSPTTLSLILQGKRDASRKLAERLSDRLMFDPQERSEVLDPFAARKRTRPEQGSCEQAYVQLTMD